MTALNKAVSRLTRADVPHGVKPEIVITLYPGGTIGLREAGRRKATELFVDVGTLYTRTLQSKIAAERMRKGKERAQARRERRLSK